MEKVRKAKKIGTTIMDDNTNNSETHVGQSQSHGFIVENSVRKNVFGLKDVKNDTNIHDIPKCKNKFNSKENCSIKTTGSSTICCGDLLRFYNYDFNDINTIIVIEAPQETDTHKIVKKINEINYNKECHELLFGKLPKEVLERYVNGVKSIPKKTKGKEAKAIFDYLKEKKEICKKYKFAITINPKVDSSQSRVQCSINNFEKTLEKFITYTSPDDKPNMLRKKEIISSIKSPRRSRGGITCKILKGLCKQHKIKKYSRLKKNELKELLKKHNIPLE
jgi:hypothetical protein